MHFLLFVVSVAACGIKNTQDTVSEALDINVSNGKEISGPGMVIAVAVTVSLALFFISLMSSNFIMKKKEF